MPLGLRRVAPALLACTLALGPRAADAHAIVIASKPGVGEVVPGPAVAIELRFNSRIDQERSRVLLVRPDGSAAPLPLAPPTSPDLLTSEAAGLGPGAYRLRWQVLSVDGHITRGDIPFKVGE